MKKKVLIASFFAMLMLTVPFSSVTIAEDQISGELQELEEQYLVVQQSNNLIPLTGDEIGYLQDLIDGIGDETTRLLAQGIIDRFITEDGELDTVQLQQVIEEYGTTGLFGGLIKAIIQWIINKIREEIMYQITGIISWWLLESLDSDQIGWLNGPLNYAYNASTLLGEIEMIWTGWNSDIKNIKNFFVAIRDFLAEMTPLSFLMLVDAFITAYDAVIHLISNFPAELEQVKENVLQLCNETRDFIEWLFPDEFGQGSPADRPYNQPITIKGEIAGIDPNDIELHCDGQVYTPAADGSFEMEFNASNKEVESYLWHSVRIAIYNTTTGDYSEIYETAFSMGTINKTFSFSGRPMKPVGPKEVERFTTQLYKSYAIDSHGARLEYQWSWNGNEGPWSSDHASGSTVSGLTFWLNLGENEVKVRSRDSNGDVSEWSESLTVTVYRRFLQGTSSSQPLQYFITQSYASIPTSQPTSQPSNQQSSSPSTTQQSTNNA